MSDNHSNIIEMIEHMEKESDFIEDQIVDITYFTHTGWLEASMLSHQQRNKIIERVNSIRRDENGATEGNIIG